MPLPYGVMRRLLSKEYEVFHETILIESRFNETTRMGKFLRPVIVGLTPNELLIADVNLSSMYNYDPMNRVISYQTIDVTASYSDYGIELHSVFPLEAVSISIFKNTLRQTLKVNLDDKRCRYFELADLYKRKIFWKLWCLHVAELRSKSKLWPYNIKTEKSWKKVYFSEKKKMIVKKSNTPKKLTWVDKYLFLGTKRDEEDKDRPIARPGLGDNLEYLYKKQQFDCTDQCDDYEKLLEEQHSAKACYSCTYSGGPTSNVTYTSIISAVCIEGFVTLFWLSKLILLDINDIKKENRLFTTTEKYDCTT